MLQSQGGIHPAIELIMTIDASSSSGRSSVVVVSAAAMLCALPLASVIETLRCPPITAISGTPECVRGLAVIRGATVVVVDLRILLELSSSSFKQARLVTLRVGGRVVGLGVDSIIGVREFERSILSEVPPMLRQAYPEVLTAVGISIVNC